MKIRTILSADEGFMLTDGTTYGKVIFPAETDDVTAYREITMEAYYELFPNERPVEEEVVEGEILEGEIESEVIEPTEEDNEHQYHAEAKAVY